MQRSAGWIHNPKSPSVTRDNFEVPYLVISGLLNDSEGVAGNNCAEGGVIVPP
jgi:hypothetical protein